MSTQTAGGKGSTESQIRYKRHLRNYLIDRRFQFKYTGMILVLSLVLIAVLGVLLWFQVLATVQENARATELSAAAAEASADAAKVSRENSEIIISGAAAEDYFKDQSIFAKFRQEMEEPALEAKAQAEKMQSQASRMRKTSTEFQKRATRLPLLLGAFGITFLGFLFLIGIYVTHKIAGPMYKINKLMSEVDGDSLHVDGYLRKGDEMWELFNSFNSMIGRLRTHQTSEAQYLEGIASRIESADDEATRKKALEELREFKLKMDKALE